MSTSQEIAAYCEGKLGPGQIGSYLPHIQRSGLTVPILGLFHIGRPEIPGQHYGDLIFNQMPDLIFSEGVFNPLNRSDINDWPGEVAKLKRDSSVKKVYFSIGGQGRNDIIHDFRTIEYMLDQGLGYILKQNFFMLRQLFVSDDGVYVIDGIDHNCEEERYVKPQTIVDFSTMLFELGFEVTFGPYRMPEWWQGCMQKLWNQGHRVSWWNVQCYHGGYRNRNDLKTWIDTLDKVVQPEKPSSFLMPGLLVRYANDGIPDPQGQCPSEIRATFAEWSNAEWSKPGLRGGWLWTYDLINDTYSNYPSYCPTDDKSLLGYVRAVRDGLTATA